MPIVLAPVGDEGAGDTEVRTGPTQSTSSSACGARSPCTTHPWDKHEVLFEVVSSKERLPLPIIAAIALLPWIVCLVTGMSLLANNFVAGIILCTVPSGLLVVTLSLAAGFVHTKSVALVSRDPAGYTYFCHSTSFTSHYTDSEGKSHSSTTYYMHREPVPEDLSRVFVVATEAYDSCCDGRLQPASLWWVHGPGGTPKQLAGFELPPERVAEVESRFFTLLDQATSTDLLMEAPPGVSFTPWGQGRVQDGKHSIRVDTGSSSSSGADATRLMRFLRHAQRGADTPTSDAPIPASSSPTMDKTIYSEKNPDEAIPL